jgi:hypothetical protein
MQTKKKATHPGKLGEHPAGGTIGAAVGTVTGALAGTATAAASGAAVGSTAGPVGAAVGAGIGGVVGALAGKGIAQMFNPTTEDEYWRENYKDRPYVKADSDYETYRPAYLHGMEAYTRYDGRKFDEIEPQLKDEWDVSGAMLPWGEAKGASRDAYERVDMICRTKK